MSVVQEHLRQSDPLARESGPTASARGRVRDAVLRAGRAAPVIGPRRRALRGGLALAGLLAAVALGGGTLWRAVNAPAFAAVRFEVRLAEDAPAPGLREAPVGLEPRLVYLHDDVILTNADIAGARVVAGASSDQFGVAVRLSEPGSARMREATRRHIGRPIALMFDGLVSAAPTVRSEIGELGVLTGNYSQSEAERIVRGLLPQ